MKATVLLATPLYPPEGGGPATFAALIERMLPQHEISVRVVPFSSVRRRSKVIRHFMYMRMLIREGRRDGGAQLLLALDPVSVGLPSLLAARILRIPLVVRVVGDYAWEQGVQRARVREVLDDFLKKTYFSPLVLVLRFVQKMVARNADAIVVPSKYLGSVVEQWGIARERVSLIYNGFKREAPGNVSIRERYSIAGKVILSVGRLVPWKGFDLISEIAPEFEKSEPPATVVIIGDGPLRSKLEERAKRNPHSLRLVGGVSHRTLLGFMKEADVFVLNTAYEGFSHLLLEAMSVGVPVVTTRVGGNVELIRDQEEGLLVPFNDRRAIQDAIRSLLSESTMRTRLIQTARRTAARFTEERMAGEYAALVLSFLTHKR